MKMNSVVIISIPELDIEMVIFVRVEKTESATRITKSRFSDSSDEFELASKQYTQISIPCVSNAIAI